MRWETQMKTLEIPRQVFCHASEARFCSENRRVAVRAQRDRNCAVMWLKKVGDARKDGFVADHLMAPDALLVQTDFRGCRNEFEWGKRE
jgi:hypothetical protein